MIQNKEAGFILSKLVSFIFFVFLILAGLFVARNASEGEMLYPLKVLGEEIEYQLTPTASGKIKLRLEQLESKPIDTREALAENRISDVIGRTNDVETKVRSLKEVISKEKESGTETKLFDRRLNAIIATQLCTLAEAVGKAESEEDKNKILGQIEMLSSINVSK